MQGTWTQRLFDTRPVLMVGVYVGVAAAAGAVLYVSTSLSGDLAEFLAREEQWWQERDLRLALILVVMLAYIPIARHEVTSVGRRTVEALRASIRWPPGALEAVAERIERPPARARRAAGLVGIALVPVTSLLVDRDPTLYLDPEYWNAVHFWTYPIAVFVTWHAGCLIHSGWSIARRLSAAARRIPKLDLLDIDAATPFARFGLRAALPGVVMVSILAFNLVDAGWVWAFAVIAAGVIGSTAALVGFSMYGVHTRIRELKTEELGRLNAAIQGDRAALEGSSIAAWRDAVSLGELLEWRALIGSVSEWPVDAPFRARFALYLAIPIGSWLGGAVVERLLDTALG